MVRWKKVLGPVVLVHQAPSAGELWVLGCVMMAEVLGNGDGLWACRAGYVEGAKHAVEEGFFGLVRVEGRGEGH